MRTSVLLLLFLLFGSLAHGQFVEVNAGLPGLSTCSIAWGDYDNDGDFDVLLTGDLPNGDYCSKVYRNNGNGSFTNIDAGLTNVTLGSVAWGDYDGDGLIDILLAGFDTLNVAISKVYHNNGDNTFTEIFTDLIGCCYGTVSWADLDNDGDLDILLTGEQLDVSCWHYITRIYRNDGNGTFTRMNTRFTSVWDSAVACCDFDNDGDLDILITGESWGESIYEMYRNNGNLTFTAINAFLSGVQSGSVAWGDYDNDGNPDILYTGYNLANCEYISRVYHNIGNNTFSDIFAGLTGVAYGYAGWGDYDNDGDLDVLITGNSAAFPNLIAKIYRNNGDNTFTWIDSNLEGVSESSAAWGDYDNDGDLDILLSGFSNNSYLSRIYRNDSNVINAPPSIPTNLHQTHVGDYTVFSWNPATDDHTPSAGLTYMLRIGKAPWSSEISGSMASSSGLKRIPEKGNANGNCSWKIRTSALPTVDNYYWSVQAVDTSFKGSEFAPSIMVDPTANDDEIASPVSSCLQNAYPNPFRQETTIQYGVKDAGAVQICIYNSKGQMIRTLFEGKKSAGNFKTVWDGADNQGKKVEAGIYLCTLKAGGYQNTRKVIILK